MSVTTVIREPDLTLTLSVLAPCLVVAAASRSRGG